MLSMNQPRNPILRRLPSPVQLCARITPYGVVFKIPCADCEPDFVPLEEVNNEWGGADSLVAHLLLRRCGGYSHMVEGR